MIRFRSLAAATAAVGAALAAACASDAPTSLTPKDVFVASRAPVLPAGCEKLVAPPAGSTLAFHAYARGVQIYRWNGTTWAFVAPRADLFADANERGRIGTHYAGPKWESVSGSIVAASAVDRCTPDASAIPWLRLAATSAEGPGIFARVATVQRVNTVGGTVPAVSGTFVGEEAEVPYTAEYYFWRAPEQP